MSWLGDNKIMIIAGASGLFALFYFMRRPQTRTVSVVRDVNTGTSESPQAQAELITAQANASATMSRAHAQEIEASNQPVLAEYMAGTAIAGSALQAAGHADRKSVV